ncbi:MULTISPECIES: amidohydrolase [unclassified Granulicatella]|uniref:amidohydrolase n=1 Tax=unclassified Granulicatella TaxID=2630493 RepID=UPI0010736EE1|nr:MULTISPECIES: amidohydrolase [unclassified Granulicatella]MBF0779962.1 amidohydrolase [Granulicatella sp. 19428wC4_WM01]TFU95978.1 amidohydrolase [Granulicatella sp. WM01]
MTIQSILQSLHTIQEWQENTYRHLHANPELSMQEVHTSAFIKDTLLAYGYDVHTIGGGIVGILKNGEGASVLFRADIDALPVKEDTGLTYASHITTKDAHGNPVPVMHACGHDMHIAAALGAAWALATHQKEWSGTYIALFQPGEETASGAKAMLEDGLLEKIPKPDLALSQHVLTTPEAGKVGVKAGAFLSSAASLKIIIHGKGAHGSMPHLSIDPIIIGASLITKLQTIVAREINPFDFAVVTVGSFQAGISANTIADSATLLLNIRAYDETIKAKLIASIKRIAIGECQAGGCLQEPTISISDNFPLTDNDEMLAHQVITAFENYLGKENVVSYPAMSASEDFSYIPRAFNIPYLYWGFGGFTKDQPIYANHNPRFAPAIYPTLLTGTKAAIIAIMTYLKHE